MPRLSKDERGAIDRVAEQASDEGGDAVQDELAGAPLDDKKGEENLQAEAPGNGAPADGAAIGGERVGKGEEDDEAEQSGETGQSWSS